MPKYLYINSGAIIIFVCAPASKQVLYETFSAAADRNLPELTFRPLSTAFGKRCGQAWPINLSYSYMKFHLFLLLAFILSGSACRFSPESMRFSSWQSSPTEERLIRECLQDFRVKHPEVEFKYEPIPGNYSEKIQLMLGTHIAPDLFWLKGYTSPSYLSFDVLQPLDGFISRDTAFDLNDFFPVFRDAFKKDGHYYGMAKDFNTYVFFYNKKMFADAGIDTVPHNWEALKAFSTRLTLDSNGDGKTDQYGLVIEPVVEMVMPFVFQNEGAFHDSAGELQINEEPFLQALEFYISLYRDGLATIPSDVGSGWNGDVFGRGHAAMAISGGWLIPYLQENYPDLEYGVTFLPAGKRKATLAFSTAYVIPKDAKYPEDAWKLLSYLAGKEGMQKWTALGLAMPTRQSVAHQNGFYEHPVYRVFMESVDFAELYQIRYLERWYDESNATLQAIFYNAKDPRLAMRDLEPRIAKYRLK